MCEYCKIMKPILKMSLIDEGRRDVKTYIGNGFKANGNMYRCLTTELIVDGKKRACSMEIYFCPICGRKLSEES